MRFLLGQIRARRGLLPISGPCAIQYSNFLFVWDLLTECSKYEKCRMYSNTKNLFHSKTDQAGRWEAQSCHEIQAIWSAFREPLDCNRKLNHNSFPCQEHRKPRFFLGPGWLAHWKKTMFFYIPDIRKENSQVLFFSVKWATINIDIDQVWCSWVDESTCTPPKKNRPKHERVFLYKPKM